MRRIIQQLADPIMPPVDPEAAWQTEKDWKCKIAGCRMPGDFFVTELNNKDEVVRSYLLCMIHHDQE